MNTKNNKHFQNSELSTLTVIDGQQRLSIYLKAYTNNSDYSNIVFDYDSCIFKENFSPSNKQIPIGILFNQDFSIFNNYLTKIETPEVNLIKTIRNKFMNYTIWIMYANNLFRDQQLNWFTELNNAGSSITESNLFLFKLDAKDKELKAYESYILPYNRLISSYGFKNLLSSKTTISYPLAALNPIIEKMFPANRKNNYTPIPSDIKTGILDSICSSELKMMFEESLNALRWTLEFFSNNNITPTRMEYITFISGFYSIHHPSNEMFNNLKIWCNNTVFTDKTNTEKRQIYSLLLSLKF